MGKLDLSALKNETGNLSTEEEEAVQAQALKDLEADGVSEDSEEGQDVEDEKPKKAKKTEESEKPEEESAGEGKATEPKKGEEEKPENDGEPDGDAEKALELALKKKAEDRSEAEKKAVSEHEEATKKKDQESFVQEAEEYADQENVSLEIAKARVQKIRETVKKFDGDPRKMAKALYHTQAAFARSQNELHDIKNAPKEGEIVIQGKKLSKEEAQDFITNKYREAYPELTEGMDDDKVFSLAKKEMSERYRLISHKKETELKDAAEKKKAEILEGIEDRDKPFRDEVKKALERVDNEEVLSPDFSVVDYVFWARGKKYHKDVQDAEKRGYERGLQEKKILGKSGDGTSSGGGQGASGGKKSSGLSAEQKERARTMFDTDIPEEKKFEYYIDFLKSQGEWK